MFTVNVRVKVNLFKVCAQNYAMTPASPSSVVDPSSDYKSYQEEIDRAFMENNSKKPDTTSGATPEENTEPETFIVLASYSTPFDSERCITRKRDVVTMNSNLRSVREVAETIMAHFELPLNQWKLIRVFWSKHEDVEKLDEGGYFTKLHNANFENVFMGLKYMRFGEVSVDVLIQDGLRHKLDGE
ncbi:hypothetical protein HYFRA_00005222 [Hymenoscyphus fraxineus]|uniref:Uncharacterized protein n=1 Tax=Hymenoscyphus fraxineus TaxID=746836 RepID=A0A9N9LCX4_9HELO|nr:hypothetical protein HYFRA_00005222 [Hymenoscyphus fraxineus]